MKRTLGPLALLLVLTACQQPNATAPPPPAAAPGKAAPLPALPVDMHLPPGFPGGPKEPPKPSLNLPGLYAVARSAHNGFWNIELHLAEPGSTRTWAVKSKEGFVITVGMEANTPVARWSVPTSRFATGDPFALTLSSQGLEAPVSIVIPSMQVGQSVVGLQVRVLK